MARSGQDSASDTSDNERERTVHDEQKVRKKKKKRKRVLTDIRQRLSKPKKRKQPQSNFVKLVQDFADLREEYGKQTKIDGKSKKSRSKKNLANRILPKPLTGIYRNGALGKAIRKSEGKPTMGDTGNARLEGNMCKLLHGYDSKSEGIVVRNDKDKDSSSKTVLLPYSSDDSASPFLGRVDGGEKRKEHEEPRAAESPQNQKMDSKIDQETALKRYEELCETISNEFEGNNFPDVFPGTDLLAKVKKKLRSSYAESFRFQLMRDAFRHGGAPVSTASSNETFYPQLNQSKPFLFTAEDVRTQKRKDERPDLSSRKDTTQNRNNLLFDPSEIDAHSPSLLEPQTGETSETYSVRSSVEVNCTASSILRNNKNLRLFDVNAKGRDNKPVLFVPEESKPVHRKHTRKERNPRRDVISSKVKKYSGVQNLKMNKQQVKVNNLKHVPTILRKGKDADNRRQNLFEMPVESTSSTVLFTPMSVMSKPADVSTFDPENARSCVGASPSTRKDDTYFMKKEKQKPQVYQDIFVQKKNPVQKTVMFTKKDSINVGQCLYVNNVVSSEKRENPNVCILKKNVPETENICTVHRNCQRIPGTCYREFKCSQNSEVSQPNCSSQEFHECQSAPKNQPIPEEVILRGMHKCDHKCNGICYVVLDQCKHGTAECSNNNNRTRELQGQLYQEDIGILNGVQNLKLIKEREARSQNAVLLEQQPIKYLAFEDDSNTRKIPIYMQNKRDVDVIDPSVNYRLVSCPKESAKEVILVPTCEPNKVVYVKQNANSREKCSHPKVVLVKESPSNVCGIHVPKQNIMEIRNPEYNVVNRGDNNKRRLNWEELHYPNYEHDVCLQNPTIYYQK